MYRFIIIPCVLMLRVLSNRANGCRAFLFCWRTGTPRDLHIGPWWCKLSEARRRPPTGCVSTRAELVNTFSTREEMGVPRHFCAGRQKEGRSGFLRATSNRFPGKTYLHMQDSATSYPSELWHVCALNRWVIFFWIFLAEILAH